MCDISACQDVVIAEGTALFEKSPWHRELIGTVEPGGTGKAEQRGTKLPQCSMIL